MDLLERAGLAPSDLVPDPLHPFKVRATSPRAEAKLRHVGWAEAGPDRRLPVLWRLFGAMPDAAWEEFVDRTLAARRASGLTWNEPPWAAWAALIEAEHARRTPRSAVAIDADKQRNQRETLLAILRDRGPKGALNLELNTAVGFRYGARLKELRDDGYVIRTDQESAQVFRYSLVSEPGMKQATMGEVA